MSENISSPPEPPQLPVAMLNAVPVIVVGQAGWLGATIAAFAMPSGAAWRPLSLAGLAVGLLGTGIFWWQRDAARRGVRGAQTGFASPGDGLTS